MQKFKNKAEYDKHVADTALRILSNHRQYHEDQLNDLCPDITDDAALDFANDVYEYMLEEMERRERPSIARHL